METAGEGYTGYRHLLSGSRGIIAVLRDAHKAVEDARARGSTALDPQVLAGLRERYDQAVKSGMTHNRSSETGGLRLCVLHP